MRLTKIATAAALVCIAPSAALADTQQAPVVDQAQAGKRLSDYLRNAGWVPSLVVPQGYYLPGLVFKREALLQQQTVDRQQLLTSLQMNLTPGQALPSENAFVSQLLQHLQPTGRLPLLNSDADYLLQHPTENPVLLPGDSGTLPKRPTTVVVVGSSGICEVPYYTGVSSQAYAQACFHGSSWWAFGKNIDELWVVQPTGQVVHRKVGNWNAEPAEVPMPGAWIVAPNRNSQINPQIWQQVADYLATQGVANIPADYGMAGHVVYAHKKDFAERAAEAPPRDMPVSNNDFGFVGLIQTPSARMRQAGNFTATASRVAPYTRYSFIFQPFDWLEGGFRYTHITNRLYGPQSFSGDQTYLDKNLDVKFKLHDETPYLPQLALGLQDIGGTGSFSGEYLVGSKRFGNFDTSLGLGFGYLGNSGTYGNPLSFISNKFNTRPNQNFGQGGNLSPNTYFRGRTALFGGVQWNTPIPGLVAKVELDGNNYQSEPLNNPQRQDSRINYGVTYALSKNFDLGVNVERGNTMGFVLALHENFATFNQPKLLDPAPVPATAQPRTGPVDWKQTLKDVQQQTNWEVTDVQTRGSEVRLKVRNGESAYYADSLARATGVLNRDLPPNINWFSFDYDQNGLNTAEHVVDRKQWVNAHTDYTLNGYKPQEEHPEQAAVEGNGFDYKTVYHQQPDRFTTSGLGIGYRQVVGGADGYLYEFSLVNNSRLNVDDSTWFDLSLRYRLLGNYDKFKQSSNSVLPHVRTDLQLYSNGSRFNIPNFQLTHLGNVSKNVYYSVYGGLLEDMFAGVGGEVLYRPFESRFALGVDANIVRQRGYNEDFSLLNYHVNTGHITGYYDTGIKNILAKVSVGQYLAGDKGVTVDLSRVFSNGATMGIFATKTNVSAQQFGEGSFDKGIYLSVPLNSFFFKSVPGNLGLLYRPLTRDGGAKLNRSVELYDQTGLRSARTLEYRAGNNE